MTARRTLKVVAETWPIRGTFTISRGSRSANDVVVAEIAEGPFVGRGEAVPYPRYGETVAATIAAIQGINEAIARGLDRAGLQHALPPGAARNALDCALWDLEAKRTGRRVWELAGIAPPHAVVTAETISIDTPAAMAAAAHRLALRPVLKIKVGNELVLERVCAVHAVAPAARLIVDANEAWTRETYAAVVPALAALGVALIEQPLRAGEDAALAELSRPVPVCADESCHTVADLAALRGRYDVVNVKLDKAGGLTASLALVAAARAQGFGLMIGCMVATSLGIAPATLLAGDAEFVDLDGPLLLARDRDPALEFDAAGRVHPPARGLWG